MDYQSPLAKVLANLESCMNTIIYNGGRSTFLSCGYKTANQLRFLKARRKFKNFLISKGFTPLVLQKPFKKIKYANIIR